MYWQTFVFYSFPFIFNSLNNSTTNTGAKTSRIISNTCSAGNSTILNMFLKPSVNSIANINAAEPSAASINLLLLNTLVLNIDL